MEEIRVGLPTGSKSHRFRKPCVCWMLLRTMEKGKQRGKSITEKAEAALAKRWRSLMESAASFTRQRCLVSLWPIFSCWSRTFQGFDSWTANDLCWVCQKSLHLAAGRRGCFEAAPEPRQFTAWQLKAALKWALVSSGCHKLPRFRRRRPPAQKGRVHGWGLCSSAVPPRHVHEGARALQWGFQRDTLDYFLLHFP